MKNAVLAQLANEQYPTSKAATEHGERLWRKHWPVIRTFEDRRDKGRAHAAIHIVAMLKDAGEHKAAGLVEHLLDWMCEPREKRSKEKQSIADGMSNASK